DSSLTLASAAAAGAGVALLPLRLFAQDLDAGRLLAPFPTRIDAGRYWLTRLRSRAESEAGRRLREWLLAEQ
ncbi:LysR substrate-binding domain-containing protein, partial [Xanthomonas translucens]